MGHHRPAIPLGLDGEIHGVPVLADPWLGGLMRLPNRRPAMGCRLVLIELSQHIRVAENSVYQVQHRLTGSPRFTQRNRAELPVSATLIPGFDAVEKRWITATPLVNRLLGIADAKERPLTLRVLHHPRR